MEVQHVLDASLALVVMFLGWTVMRIFHSIDELWKKHDEQNQRLTDIAIDLPKQYVTKDDLSKAFDIVHDRFDKLDAKLDSLHSRKS